VQASVRIQEVFKKGQMNTVDLRTSSSSSSANSSSSSGSGAGAGVSASRISAT